MLNSNSIKNIANVFQILRLELRALFAQINLLVNPICLINFKIDQALVRESVILWYKLVVALCFSCVVKIHILLLIQIIFRRQVRRTFELKSGVETRWNIYLVLLEWITVWVGFAVELLTSVQVDVDELRIHLT